PCRKTRPHRKTQSNHHRRSNRRARPLHRLLLGQDLRVMADLQIGAFSPVPTRLCLPVRASYLNARSHCLLESRLHYPAPVSSQVQDPYRRTQTDSRGEPHLVRQVPCETSRSGRAPDSHGICGAELQMSTSWLPRTAQGMALDVRIPNATDCSRPCVPDNKK